ncbi:MAG: hypothetical protein EZS28_014583 [Streblomastix strix]|uniref:Uncharacterized protein n=1 Tax=Streblomastix strix TaxID=222440 RepID=A0A5J4W4U5_9EUKA|nr:MAG: hypothetical protein EZS28_014583 [Streblomastix strix]
MSICFFRLNEIAEIRLKFSNVNKPENQTSLKLAPKQANAIEIYEVYETDNEKLSPKLAIYEWIDRLKKQFPKGTDFYYGIKRAEDSMSISILKTTLSNNRTCKARINNIARQLTSNLGQDNESGPPKICIPTRGEIEIRREFPRELKDRTSGMLLKVGWSAWNDNAEIRTFLCQSLISLITDYRQREVINEFHRRI